MNYNEILQAVIDMAEAAVGVSIVTGSLPPDNGVAMTGSAAPDSIFLDKGSDDRMSVLCNAKHRDQETAIDRLADSKRDILNEVGVLLLRQLYALKI